MKRETPRTNRRRTRATLPAILTLLGATPAPVLAAYPAGKPVDTQEARPSAPIDPRTTPAVQLHLDGVTPEDAAAALLGDGNLSPVQLDALDQLGNRNGGYDLGDLLSWVERCRHGEVDCGTKAPGAPAPPFGVAGLLSGGAFARRRVREMHAMSGSTRSVPRRGASAFGRRSVPCASWRGMSLWYAFVLLFVAALLWGCADADDLVRLVSLEPDPGYLTVELNVPEGAHDGIPGGDQAAGPVVATENHRRDSPALRAGRRVATFLLPTHVPGAPAPSTCKLYLSECKPDMSPDHLTVALVTDVFPASEDTPRLPAHLRAATSLNARLAVLPELPLHPWTPLTRQPSRADAEPPRGPRHRTLAAAARDARLALLGGTILRDPDTGRRHNTALLFGPGGEPLLDYRKVHLPDEEGYWEAHHYEPGDRLEPPARLAGWGIGVQICSDANRLQACSALAAMGAEVILIPRATPAETWARWRLVLRAAAVTSCAYVISVNRPGTRSGGVIGGPSVAVAPTGDVLLETTDPVAAVTLERPALEAARREYPGYLDVRADVYGDAWRRVRGPRHDG